MMNGNVVLEKMSAMSAKISIKFYKRTFKHKEILKNLSNETFNICTFSILLQTFFEN